MKDPKTAAHGLLSRKGLPAPAVVSLSDPQQVSGPKCQEEAPPRQRDVPRAGLRGASGTPFPLSATFLKHKTYR